MKNMDKIQEISQKNLFRVTESTPVPFQLRVNEHDQPICCEKIIRVMPGKRMVFLGTWDDQFVVGKIFFGRRAAKRHYHKELNGIELLLASGVPTPKMLYHGTAYKGSVYVLLFEQLLESKNLYELWQNKTSPEEQTELMHSVTIELATQHVLGIMQHDLHLKNFLLQGNQVYTLDGGNIECMHEPLERKTSLEHLGLFFSQLGIGVEELHQALFQAYVKARGWLVKQTDADFLKTSIEKWNQERWKKYQEKTLRDCTEFAKITQPNAFILYDRHYYSNAFLSLLADPESVFSHPDSKLLKAGRSSSVVQFILDGKKFVIKRYNIKNNWHWLRRSLRMSRAVSSWRLAHLLKLFGVPTARPVACIEKRFIGLRHTSYLIMEYVKGESLEKYFESYNKEDAHFEKIASRVVQLLKNLAKLRVSHGDLKATNILIEEDRPVLIDLDGMKEYKTEKATWRAYQKEIKRFMKNWQENTKIKELFERFF